jgi:hypothetical protein
MYEADVNWFTSAAPNFGYQQRRASLPSAGQSTPYEDSEQRVSFFQARRRCSFWQTACRRCMRDNVRNGFQQRTFTKATVTSALCQQETHAPQHYQLYSITSSAATSRPGGTVRPSAFAVLRLMTRRNRVGCSSGRSAGFSPFRTRRTRFAPRSAASFSSGP